MGLIREGLLVVLSVLFFITLIAMGFCFSLDVFFNYAILSLTIAIILSIIIFFLAEIKSNFFLIVGTLLLISSLFFKGINKFLDYVKNTFLQSLIPSFAVPNFIILRFVICGVIILFVGIIMKLLGVGFKIEEFFSKFKKKEVLEEKPKEIIKKEEKKVIKVKPKLKKPKKKKRK